MIRCSLVTSCHTSPERPRFVETEGTGNRHFQLSRLHALGTPSRAEASLVAARTAARIEKILRKAGRSLDAEMAALEEPPELCEKEPGLAACYAAAAQGVTVSGDRAFTAHSLGE
jgi:hypothetical protein